MAKVIAVAALPLITRLYTPAEYGIYALYVATISFASVFFSGRYELAVLLPKKNSEASNLLAVSLALCGIFTIICLLLILLGKGVFLKIGGEKDFSLFIPYLPFALFFLSVNTVFSFWFLRQKAYTIQSTNRVIVAGVTAGCQLLAGWIDTGARGLVYGHIIGLAAGVGFFSVHLFKFNFMISDLSWADMKKFATRYKKFPLLSVWDVFANRFALFIPVWLLTMFYSPSVAGLFSMARNIYGIPTSLIGEPVSRVFLQKAGEEVAKSGTTHRLVRQTFLTVTGISFICIGGIALCAPFAFGIVFGKQWDGAALLALSLLPLAWMRFLVVPVSPALIAHERQGLNLLWQSALACLTFLCYYFFRHLPLENLVLLSSSILGLWYLVLLFLTFRVSTNTGFLEK